MGEAEARKQKSENILTEMGVTINPHLPVIEQETEAVLRPPEVVSRRIIVLCNLVSVARNADREEIIVYLKNEDMWQHVSTREKVFFKNESPDEMARYNATWRIEAVWLLLWALSIIPELGMPEKQCDPREVLVMVPGIGEPTGEFITNAKLRPVADILDKSDLIYRAHWATRERKIKKFKAECGNLDNDIVKEWHYAINWLTCYSDLAWDHVTTDT